MNKIKDLFDRTKVIKLLKRKLLPLYPNFSEIKDLEIIDHKRNIWGSTYHVVLEFKTQFINHDNEIITLPIFCTAHSSEPRKNVYDSLKFLWQSSFSSGDLSIPHPLFYSEYYNGTFYRGAEGWNLYRFIRDKNFSEIEVILPRAAAWFAKLHAIPTTNAPNFNEDNSRIATVYPGIPHILARIKDDYPDYYQFYKTVYSMLDSQEKKFFASTQERYLVHGDAHPENIIKMSERKIAVIDFTDLCLADFARDLGTFLQQLEFMCKRKINDLAYVEKVKKLFLDSYTEVAKITINGKIKERIDTYYYWTAIRTATFFLIKYDAEPKRAYAILGDISNKLGIKI